MIFSTVKHLLHILASSSNLLYMVCQHCWIARVRSKSRMNESWKILFQFYRRIVDRGWWSDFPETPTTEQNSKLGCNGEFFQCSLDKTCCECPAPSAPESLSIHNDWLHPTLPAAVTVGFSDLYHFRIYSEF